MILLEYFGIIAFTAVVCSEIYAAFEPPLKNDIDVKYKIQPLLLIEEAGNSTFVTIGHVKPNGDINLRKGQNLLLICSGQGNCLAMEKKNQVNNTEGICETEKLLQVGTFTTEQIKEAKCLLPNLSTTKSLKQRCANGLGKSYEVGFKANGWKELYSFCFDDKNLVTLYTVHSVESRKILQENFVDKGIPLFKEKIKIYRKLSTNSFFKTSNQMKIFQTIFGKTRNRYSNKYRLFKRSSLVPSTDFYFPAWKVATLHCENTFGQWQSISKGNWARIEAIIPELSYQMKRKLNVTTLVYGVLELPDEKGNLQKIYMDYEAKRIPVPKYSIKIIYEPINTKGIALVTLNNRYIRDYTNELLCTDICMQNGWVSPQSGSSLFETKDPSLGVTICCDIQKLKATIPYIPDIKVTGVLQLTTQQQRVLGNIVKQNETQSPQGETCTKRWLTTRSQGFP